MTLAAMPPWQGGGEMIDRVSFEGTTFQAPPFRFEAGTPHIAGAVDEGYRMVHGARSRPSESMSMLRRNEYLTPRFSGVTVLGSAPERAALRPFSSMALTLAM